MEDRYLVRSKEGAILNTDKSGLESYRRKKQKTQETDDRIRKLEGDIDFIKKFLMEKLG